MSGGLLSMAKRQVKRQMIRGALEAIAVSHADRFLTSPAGRGAIFTLHHVRPERDLPFKPNRHLSVTPEFLEQAIVAALDHGLVPVHLSNLPELLSDPSDRRKFVCFTLDDGFRDNAQYAAPMFRKYNIPYTIFIAPGFIERTRTMWWETAEALIRYANSFFFDFGSGVEKIRSASMVEKWIAFERFLKLFHGPVDEDDAVARIDRAARDCGIDAGRIINEQVMDIGELKQLLLDPLVQLGAHTLTHPNLTHVSADRLQHEIKGSITRVADYCGYIPTTFSYPYGQPNATGPRETEAARANGFAVAVTTQPGVLRELNSPKFVELPRISLNGYFQHKRYVRALASGLPFQLLRSRTADHLA